MKYVKLGAKTGVVLLLLIFAKVQVVDASDGKDTGVGNSKKNTFYSPVIQFFQSEDLDSGEKNTFFSCQIPYDPEMSVILTDQEEEKMDQGEIRVTEFCEGLAGDLTPKVQDLNWSLSCKFHPIAEGMICGCVAFVWIQGIGDTRDEASSDADQKCDELLRQINLPVA